MDLSLVLPWFPIVLAVGVGGRLLGRTRGLALGILCALFWVVLVQASLGTAVWHDPWRIAAVLAGAVAVVAMGGWSGQTPDERLSPAPRTEASSPGKNDAQSDEPDVSLESLSTAIDQFDDWLEGHRGDGDPWPKFDEFIRSVMYHCCRATHVRPYRILSEGDELVPLRESGQLIEEAERLSARRGIVGHVVTTGRSYIEGNVVHGELLRELTEESPEPIVWCFAVRQGLRRLGAVTVGQLDIAPQGNRSLLRAIELLINQFWCTLSEALCSRSATENDPVSGLRTRPVFLPVAEQTLQDSYRHGEPVAVAVVALEGLRELNDTGRWEVADELVREVAGWLRRKVRLDDCLGRFDGSRFILLLRRVDSELASLIVTQIMSRTAAICGDEARWHTVIGVRCGVAGSGTGHPDLRTLISRALVQCRRARLEGVPIASDLGSIAVLNEVVS